jgi:OmpA-OmpF porin, OOP family
MLCGVAPGTSWIGLASLSLCLACAAGVAPVSETPRAAPKPPPVAPEPAGGAVEGNGDRDHDGVPDAQDDCPDTAGQASRPERNPGCPQLTYAREGPNVAILLSLDPKSATLEKGKDFEVWSSLADAILKAEMCAEIQTFVIVDDPASHALSKRRAAVAEQFLLHKGFTKERLLVKPSADPNELVEQGVAAEQLRNGVLLVPREQYECHHGS